uniref:Transposon protein, putative, unclassified n=1 Tax=Oryza sativa subsp. japonica TaxID=39947 RepID=Q2QSM5_ORYSJ|nr:transposon protein, putative, unclassified [Oryza sativa Japonica Group]
MVSLAQQNGQISGIKLHYVRFRHNYGIGMGLCSTRLSELDHGKRRNSDPIVTTGNNPTGFPDVRALILVPGGKPEPQTKPYPLDMWKYGSALQQRPELNPYSGRGATSHNWHAPKPHRKQVLGVLKEEESRERARGPGPREWGPRVSLSVHGWTGRTRLTAAGAVGPTRQPHPRARAADGRVPPGSREGAPEGGLAGTAEGRGTRPRPDGHRRRPPARRSGTRERGGKGEANGAVFGSPRSTATTGTAAEAEEGGGAVRDDEDDGAPSVGERNGGANEVDGNAAKPMEVTPSGEEVRSDGGGEPELVGDGGERGRRREHECDGESERRTAETEERGTGDV